MKIKLILLLLGLMLFLKVDQVRAGAACAPIDCISGRPVNFQSTCVIHTLELFDYCVQKWGTYYPSCDSECRYTYDVPDYYWKCTASSIPANGCAGDLSDSLAGTCCINDPGGGGGGCLLTAPTNLRATFLANRAVRLNWTPGTHLLLQQLAGGINQSEVIGGCPSGVGLSKGCQFAVAELGKTVSSYTTANNVLLSGTSGRVYFFAVKSYYSETCQATQVISDISSCNLSTSNMVLDVGEKQTLTAQILDNDEIDRVTFSDGGSTKIDLSRNVVVNRVGVSDTYSTQITGVAPTTTAVTVTVRVFLKRNPTVAACTSTMTVQVNQQPSITVSGTVRTDDARASRIVSGKCTVSPQTSGIRPGVGSTVTIGGADSNTVAANGTYSITTLLSGSKSIKLTPGNGNYICNCPGSCEYTYSLQSGVNVTGLDFYVTTAKGAWWQAN